ncbi:hypothetical protein CAPTEDRAFT_199755 [Capitella teleta]|uniref:Sulfotransferase domain-containing protein n=1 Tax=Capitella teleta TaxID=283909 RepID=R7VDE9_CAPTE|nr:hypothetical protein CAPTEDRAFT_199755 [Capitella teleta]|eukprot:ELU14331.1 hypothetical protein CAPTEDRAFT_199755 [Capitella teleta]
MALRWCDSIRLIAGNFISKCFFLFLRLIFLVLQSISWKINGITNVTEKNSETGSPVAQAFKKVAWNKYCFLLPPSLRDFILEHDEYVDLDYVVQHDNICLFFFDPHQDVVVFAEAEPGRVLWKSSSDSFVTMSQYKHAERLIVMRMADFHKLCATLPDPTKSVIIMGNTGRCGSTLLTQVYEYSNKVISISEPYPLNNLAVMYRQKGFSSEVLQMTRSIIRMYCRPHKCVPNPEGYLLKPTGPSLACTAPITKLYPQTKTFYLYRQMNNVAKSMYKMSFFLPTMRCTYFFSRFSGNLTEMLFEKTSLPTEGTNRTVTNDHSASIFQAAVATKMYRMMRDEGTKLRAIFKASGLPESLVTDALKAFERDSQTDSVVSMEKLSKIKPLEYTKEDQEESSKILEELGFPRLDQDCHLEGTMDFKEVLGMK